MFGWIAFLILVVSLCPAAAGADLGAWASYPPGVGGPGGGSVRRIVEAPGGKLWAATDCGLYSSIDGGAHWSNATTINSLGAVDVRDVAVAATDANRLAVATNSCGVKVSTNGGVTWTQLTINFASKSWVWFNAVAFDPTNPNRLLAGTKFNNSNNYVFELTSANNGVTWTYHPTIPFGADGSSSEVTRIRFSADGSKCFYAFDNGHLFSNTGYLWGFARKVFDFALPGGAGDAFAVAAGSAGLWTSPDGFYFTQTYVTSDTQVVAVAEDPTDANRVLFFTEMYLGSTRVNRLYQSGDRGNTYAEWTGVLGESLLTVNGLFLTAQHEYLLENQAGIFRRANRTGVFAPSTEGLTAFRVQDIAFTEVGNFSTDGGHHFAVSGSDPDQPGNGGVLVWDEGAGQWLRRVGGGLYSKSTRSVAFDPHGGLWASIDGVGFYSSADDGLTWSSYDLRASVSQPSNAALDAIHAIRFGADSSVGVIGTYQAPFYHYDDPAAWWMKGQGLPSFPDWTVDRDIRSTQGFFSSTVQTPNPQSSAFYTKVYVTADGGKNWAGVDGDYFNDKGISSLAASGVVPGHIYAGTTVAGLHESFDGGETWAAVPGLWTTDPEQPLAGASVAHIALGPWQNDLLSAVYLIYHRPPTYEIRGAIFATGDGGATWTKLREDAATYNGQLEVAALAIAPDGKSVIASVAGRGLQYYELGAPPSLGDPGPIPLDPAVNPLTISFDIANVGPAPAADILFLGLRAAGGDPASGVYDFGTDHVLTWWDSTWEACTYYADLTLTDGFYSNNVSVTLEVPSLPGNTPPTIDPIADPSVQVGNELRFTVTPRDNETSVTLLVQGLPPGATFNEATNQFVWTPSTTAGSPHTVSFTAVDSNCARFTRQVSITVNAAPPPPTPGGGGGGGGGGGCFLDALWGR